ncbi:FK506 binding protein proline rotamase rapamycin-binding protein [Marasmius oreades]|uniref:peptidylprolyl isomerase n=1 Tax=Marasmius oreades TaxID=181124 RepID=A0A9P7RSJ8_9AGAR|nr:FK506 binding protein proline rotamase rapamycin-binding protein [Marasmius oreades]KAG7088303.1 FK506 binding protein proline rotamase rapamycin-binding protein [Marasmius oreades]
MGLTIEIVAPGDGKTYPRAGDIVSIHYVGTLEDGTQFDSSYDRGRPFQVELGVGAVIKGWEEGVLKLSKGEKAILTIPPNLAYGDEGVPSLIPPNALLKFEMQLLEIHRPVS